jgi:26S proteasome regulatory subunit (ATPase 3-interacting protein)
VTAEEKAAIGAAHTTTVTLWRKRKRMATDVLDSILESWPKPKKTLFEDIGVDTDEEAGVKLPK